MATNFSLKPRREDPAGHMIVQRNLEFLRDVVDAFTGKLLRGSATVPNAATTVVVTHGLGSASYAVVVTPTADPGGRFWVSGKSSTQFTINLSAAAGGAGVPFDWIVKGA